MERERGYGISGGRFIKRYLVITTTFLAALSLSQTPQPQDLTNLPIEDLMKVEVTTASKSAQTLSDIPSAVFVITAEDIRRSGAMNIPEALRLAPGVEVAQINSSQWAISIRGFNNQAADKLLVLIDGRSVFTPLFSGVYWDAQSVPLIEVDRIEVIRGPGGSLWGTNAVNGIINIITKNASKTQGLTESTEAGTDVRLNTTLQYGGLLEHGWNYRFSGQSFDRSASDFQQGGAGPDNWSLNQGRFRLDSSDTGIDKWMFEGSVVSEHLGEEGSLPLFKAPYYTPDPARYPASEYNLVGRWERNLPSGSSQSLETYFDHTERDAQEIGEKRDTFDIDYQNKLAPTGNHVLTYGVSWMHAPEQTPAGNQIYLTPSSFVEDWYSAFLHDTMSLNHNLKVLFGSKIENDPFVGWQFEPNAQLLYTPQANRTYWASISRAVSTPSTIETQSHNSYEVQPIPGVGPGLVSVIGNPNFQAESVLAFEAGARGNLGNKWFLDVDAFYNHYNNLRTFETGQPYFNPSLGYLIIPETFGNKMVGDTAGVELSVNKQLSNWWKMSGSYSLFGERLALTDNSQDGGALYGADGRGGAARNKFQVHSYMDLPKHFEFDNDLYYVDALIDGTVPAYFRLDSRIGWHPSETLDFSIGGRNLLTQRHIEAGEADFSSVEEISRSFYIKATLHFR
jgi:iron complex outermembrane recepter protein